ncbi:MAG: DUF2085 domain-containing protein [Chloroflexaceae bacterium]|jgi:uncharacterized membrane protein|nr:DUF2085 domain-containing protein [Chloroflexaceae bacterium]
MINKPEDILRLAQQEVERRREEQILSRQQAQQAQIERDRPWRYAFLAFAGVLLAGLLLTPGMPLHEKMFVVAHGICSQENTMSLGGLTFPVCARNSGIYMSFLLTLGYIWLIGRSRAGRLPPLSITITLAAFVVIMAVDGFNSLFEDVGLPHLYQPMNWLRTLTGMGLGVGLGVILHLMLNLSLRKDVDDSQPVLRSWSELLGILGVNFLVLAAIYGNLSFMYWPLAFVAFLGILGVLYLVCLLLTSLFLGYESAITRPAQLARPATVAILPTLLIVGGLAALRFWLELNGLMV